MKYFKVLKAGDVVDVWDVSIDQYLEYTSDLSDDFDVEEITKEEYDALHRELESKHESKDNEESTPVFLFNYTSAADNDTVEDGVSDLNIKLTILDTFKATGSIPEPEVLDTYFEWLKK